MGFKTVKSMPPMRRRSGGPRSEFTIEVQAAIDESKRTGLPVELDVRYPTPEAQQKIGFRYRAVAAKLGMGLSLAFTEAGFPVLLAKPKGEPAPEVEITEDEPEEMEVEFTEPTPKPTAPKRTRKGTGGSS